MQENNEQTLYEILKISPTATSEEIKIAYRKMAMKYHPDVNPDANDEMMYKINEAYKVLKDTKSRRLYDETLRKSGQYQKNNSTTGFDNQNNPTQLVVEKILENTQVHHIAMVKGIVIIILMVLSNAQKKSLLIT